MKKTFALLFAFSALLLPAHAIKIQLDYTYDTSGFFNVAGRKEALRAVADYYESILKDSLLEINRTTFGGNPSWTATFSNPTTGNSTSVSNLVIPADTLIVYIGARDMAPAGQGGPGGYSGSGSQAWLNLLKARGQTGALASPATDFGPWGGSIAFDTNPTGFTWNFSMTTPVNGQLPFVSIALHEMAHLLGFGTSDSWTAKVSGTNFTGAASVLAYGGNVPLTLPSHWREDNGCTVTGYTPGKAENVLNDAFGLFGTAHGLDQIVLMDTTICPYGPFHKVMTDLDLAALKDIGWQFDPPLLFSSTSLNPTSLVYSFAWPSSSGITYRIERNYTLTGSWTTVNTQAGNGDIQTFTSAATTGQPKAFYRLNTLPVGAAALRRTQAAVIIQPAPASVPPVVADGCKACPSLGAE